MAIIKTSNTYSLAGNLEDALRYNLTATTEASEEINYSIYSLEEEEFQSGTYEEDGGRLTNSLTSTDTRVDIEREFENFPNNESLNFARETGTENSYLTGNNLNTDLRNSIGFGWSESTTVTGDRWEETDKETSNGKHNYNDGTLTITEFNLKETETEKYNWEDDNYSWSESSTYNFTGAASYEIDAFSITAKTIKSTETWAEKSPDGNASGKGSLELTSQSGVSYSANYTYEYDEYDDEYYPIYGQEVFSGFINSIKVSDNASWSEDGERDSSDDFYQSTNALNIASLNDGLDAFLEVLLASDDKITGTSKEDNDLYGGAGNDTITGNSGQDTLIGGTGNDVLKSGAGNDDLYGGSGNDTLDSGAGDDYLVADSGNDALKGGAGNDYLEAGTGNDTLDGGAGNDLLLGGTGTDTLKGAAGTDTFAFDNDDSSLTQAELDTVNDFKVAQNDKLAFNLDFEASDITLKLGKDDKKLYATYNDLLAAANDSGAKIFVGYTAADKKNGYAFVNDDGLEGMDMAIKLTGVTSSTKISADSFTNELPYS